jgi:xylulose-5-phosphate/fructose-6-phosphate phosphoketolase
MTVLNELDRFHLVIDVIDRVAGLGTRYAHVKQDMRDRLVEHRQYICEQGDDLPAVRDWVWPAP